jgi:hydroxyacylglutathione hydrolase
MLFEMVVSEGIAHNSYIIGSGGSAAVIDPRRDCEVYRKIAAGAEMSITHIIETHRNEDYVIGSQELSARCGAGIFHGANLSFSYGNKVKEGDAFRLGSLELGVLETPGHTEESISIVVRDLDVSPDPYMIFSGDTLFSGDIARTDFYGADRRAEMAEKIYDSITKKILPLGDGVIVCPAHGAGSICGAEIADHPFSTIGYERKTNRLLLKGKEAFVEQRVRESPYVPPYFRQMEQYNKTGAPVLLRLPRLHPLGIAQVHQLIGAGAQVVDIRSPTAFGAGQIPGSLSIWRDGIPAFAGWFLTYEHPVLLIDDFNLGLDTVVRRLVRLGFDNIAGFLAGGFPTWFKGGQEIATIQTCSVQQLEERLKTEVPFLLDVRDIRNYQTVGHIRGAHHTYVGELPRFLPKIPRDDPVVVYCDAGWKGSLAASYLKKNRFHDVTNVLGGMQAWKNAGFRIEKSQ